MKTEMAYSSSVRLPYSFLEHKHRFAAWCASTAASASRKCRFRVAQGVAVLTDVKIANDVEVRAWEKTGDFDRWHSSKCLALVESAARSGIHGFSYGVAAKMLNCYLKAFWIGDEGVLAVAHPPIDRILLEKLAACDFAQSGAFWRTYKKKGWSKFSEADYVAVIGKIRESSLGGVMWKVEEYWQGFQNP